MRHCLCVFVWKYEYYILYSYKKKGESPESRVNERGNTEKGIENEVCRKVIYKKVMSSA